MHADLRVGPVAHLARHHERDDARDVRLVGQRHQVEHQPDVLLEVERDAGRARRQLRGRRRAGSSSARWMRRSISRTFSRYSFSVCAIRAARAAAAGSPLCLVTASRMLRSSCDAREPLGRAAALAEHPLEHLARIDLHRQRRRRRAPRERVHVDAAVVAVAGADQAGVILGRELQRRQRRVLADRCAAIWSAVTPAKASDALRRLRTHAAQPRRRAQRVDGRGVGRAMCRGR